MFLSLLFLIRMLPIHSVKQVDYKPDFRHRGHLETC